MYKKLLHVLALSFMLAAVAYAQPDPCLSSTNPLTVGVEAFNDGCDCNGVAQIFAFGGTAPYFYSWSQNSTFPLPLATGLCPGAYTVTVIDANDCTASANFYITGYPPATISLNVTQPTCGQNNGAITAMAIGGLLYLWSNGATTQNITGLQAGTYCVTVTDLLGCTAAQCVALQSALATEYQPPTCGLCNGSIFLPDSVTYYLSNPNGATQFYDGPTTITGLCPGWYDLFTIAGECQGLIQLENIDLPFTANANFNTSIGNADELYACTGQPIQFFAPDGNLAVQWNFGEPASLTNTSNLPNTTYTYQNTGTYTVTLIAQGCTDADTLQRTIIIEQGIAPAIECASLVCPGTPQTYTTPTVCDTYNWTVTGGTITGGQNTAEITVVWNDVAMGTVELTVGNCDGSTICNPVGSINVPVISNNIPITGPDVVCANANAVYSLPQYGGVQYNWSVMPTAAGTVVWQQYNQAGIHWNSTDGTVQVSMSSNLVQCNAQNSLPVQVNQVYAISGPETVCANQTLTYTASAGLHNWSVSGSAAITAGGTNSSSVTVLAGSSAGFTVSATPADITQYCNYPQQISVQTTPQPATPLVTGETIICPGNAYTYQIAAPAPGFTYLWTVTGGTPASGSGATLNILWQSGSPVFGISVTAQSGNEPFCISDAGTLTATPLQNLLISGDDELCTGDKITYTAAPLLAGIDYIWQITPPQAGSVVSGQGGATAEVQWNSGYAAAALTVTACGISVQHNITIHEATPPAIVASGNLCAGSSIGLSVVPATYVFYEWSNSAIAPGITVSAGNDYVVSVTDANGCTANATLHVHEYPLPDASVSAQDINLICSDAPNNVNISALLGYGYNYQWFENGAAFGANVSTITHFGSSIVANFSYSVQVTDANGCQNVSNTVVIEQDVCNFNSGSCPGGACPNPGDGGGTCAVNSADILGIVADTPYCFDVTFQNISTGGLSYTWDFGDDSPTVTLPDASPQTHSYTDAGFYTVKIYGTYANLNPTPTNCIYMSYTVVEIPLAADFDFISPCINTATEFADRSVHIANTTITSWNWDFGDGNTSTDANPAHTFAAAGTYNVTLTIGNGLCTHTLTKPVTIYNLPDASFAVPPTVCQGSAAAFTPAANPNAIQWDWNFGNGATVSAQQPEQSYLQDGNYTVTLAVTDNKGCTNTAAQTVTVLPVDNGSISLPSPNACEGQTVTLTAPTGAGYLWSDNSSGSTLNVTQTGSFTVTVTQANGCQYSTPPVQVNFAPLPPAVISPAASPLLLCPNQTATLTANAGSNYAYAWSNGTNNASVTLAYNSIPVAGITLYVTVTNASTGCSNTSAPVAVQRVTLENPVISPNFAAALQLCQGETLSLSASHPALSNFNWNTGQSGNSITVSAGGYYEVSVTDANGCIETDAVTVGMNSGGDLAAIPVGCYDYCELASFSVPGVYAGYQWLLNGAPIAGATGSEFVPPQSGDYQLQITTPFGCQDTSDVLSLNLTDCLECLVSANFTYTISCSSISLSAVASGNGTLSYSWDFGDGNTSANASPSHSFAASGTYAVCLTVSNIAADADTCTQTFCQNIDISGADLLAIVTDNITNAGCGAANGSISITINGNNPPYTYQWSDANTGEDRTGLAPANYGLTVTDAAGCTVAGLFTISELPVDSTTLTCISATDTGLTVGWATVPGAQGYELTINGAAPITIDAAASEYTFTGLAPDISYTIGIAVLAPSPCANSATVTTTCTTLPDPCLLNPPVLSTQPTDALCGQPTGSIDLSVTGGILPYNFAWSNLSAAEDLANANAGSYSVTVTDAQGCSAVASETINAYLPAPQPLCLSATDTTLTVGWAAVPGAQGYELSINGAAPVTADAAASEYTFTDLLPETAYNIGIAAVAPAGCSNSQQTALDCSTATPACTPETTLAEIQTNTPLITVGETVQLTVQTEGLSGNLSYVWTANGLETLCTDSLCTFMPDAPTTYTVTVTDEFGCTAVAGIDIDVRMPNKVLIPNAFSPNADGVNNVFRIAGYNVSELQFSVWNRWGQKVYESGVTPDLNTGWNGQFNNKDCEIGVYVYMAQVRYTDGTEEWLQGNVTLVR
ncbi:PKD domain-containing protein [Sphingobacteriales bacterium UPWRP_1]|nr:hypothetical protein BVG80_03175 [Sphingobacteriales bacterium TSM_CSM]PSJ75540.1 PKD domain-containing protein [Sphingobacteriales bacterium UPWRP_1]